MVFATFSVAAQTTKIEPSHIQAIDTTQSLEATFAFIAEEIGDSRIVGLGEQTHTPDVSFTIRAKLVEYLIEHQGFEVILFEAGMFDLHVAAANAIEQKDITELQDALYGFWGNTAFHNRLFTYLQSQLDACEDIAFAGFDSKLTSRQVATTDVYSKMLAHELSSAGVATTSDEYVEYLNTWQAIEESRKQGGIHALVFPMSNEEKERFLHLSDFFQKKLTAAGNRYWSRMISGIDESIAVYSDFSMEKVQADPSIMLQINNKRDSLMADNLQYLLEETYKDKKVILIGASYHFVRNVDKITPSTVMGLDFSKSVTTGQIINDRLDEKVFTFGFMAPTEYSCGDNTQGKTTTLGCLQQQAGYPIAYHPLHKWNLKEEDASQQQVIPLFMPQSPSQHANWNEVIDAVVFINKSH